MTDENDAYGDSLIDMSDDGDVRDENIDAVLADASGEDEWEEVESKAASKPRLIDDKKKLALYVGGGFAAVLVAAVGAMMLSGPAPSARPTTQSVVNQFDEPPQPNVQAADARNDETVRRVSEDVQIIGQMVDRLNTRTGDMENAIGQVSSRLIDVERQQLNDAGAESGKAVNDEINELKNLIAASERSNRQLAQKLDRVESRLKSMETPNHEAVNPGAHMQQDEPEPFVVGSNLELISSTEGLAFLRRISGDKTPFSLEVGESLRGWGRVTRVTSLGCIYIGDKTLEAQNAQC